MRALLAALLAAALDGPPPSNLRAQMESESLLDAAAARQLEGGAVVARVLDSPDRAEIVSFAALRVRATTARFLACVGDVSCLKAHEEVLEVGRFAATPSVRDLAGLSLDPRDRDYLARCRSGRCDVRLPDDAIERFRTGIDWASPRNAAAAADLFRITLAGFASAYLAGGNGALALYHDNPRPTTVGASLDELLRRRWLLLDGAPELADYLRDFPDSHLPATDDYLYWYKERFWRKTLVSLNHVTVYRKDAGAVSRVYVASKQLYASHYHESAVELLVYESDPGGAAGTLFFFGRVRADIRPGGFNWLERLVIHRLVRGRLEGQFRRLRSRLELPSPAGELH